MTTINTSETEELVHNEIQTYKTIVKKAYDATIENINEGFQN